jgi:serine/threonine-protein kinase RsbT
MSESRAVHTIEIRVPGDIVTARRLARDVARNLQLGTADQTRLATVVSELTRNALQYAGGGSCSIRDASDDATIRIDLTVEDHGPGIPSIALAMQDGYSTSGGLGAGLPGSKRLMDAFDVQSQTGLTRITAAMLRRRA